MSRCAGRWIVASCLLLGLSSTQAAPLVRDQDVLGGKFLLAMLQDIEAVPAVNPRSMRVEDLPPFSVILMKEYCQEESGRSKLRKPVGRVMEVLHKALPKLPREFRVKNVDELRETALQVQKVLAISGLEVDEALETLREIDDAVRNAEPRVWRARYDFARARLLEYRAFIHEYQFQLAEIRGERLPLPLKESAWKLAASSAFSCRGAEQREAKRLAEEARTLRERIVEEHDGTPWAYFARQETELGLRWVLQEK